MCLVTRDSAATLEWWMARVLDFADEVLVAVDVASSDSTLDIARAYADTAIGVELAGISEPATNRLVQAASADWVLLLDDDETMSPEFTTHLPSLLGDRSITHYHLPLRWVVPRQPGSRGWLRQFPWYPDRHLRLFRNLAGIADRAAHVHGELLVAGEGAALDPDGPVQMYHLDLLWHDRTRREEKTRKYRARAGDQTACEEMYLYEDYLATTEVVELDPAQLEGGVTDVAQAAIDKRKARQPLPIPAVIPLSELMLDQTGHQAPIWGAEYVTHGTPTRVGANRGYAVPLSIRNTSSSRWTHRGLVTGRVVLCYRWLHPTFGVVIATGDRTLLPRSLPRDETVNLVAGLWTPERPGVYRLEWDMLCEGVGWFSQRGVHPLPVEVEVVDEGNRTTHRHFSRVQIGAVTDPAIVNSPAAGSLVAISPVRVLDTRDGSGVPGARLGPVASGALVTLSLAGHASIPASAIGVTGVLAIPESTFDGYITAFPTDGTRGESFVSAYFSGRTGSSCNQVVSPLGTGEGAGKLTLKVSSGEGSVQLLFDVTGYIQ